MKFGTRIYGIDPKELARIAVRAEELGYDSLWRGEHVVIPVELDEEFPYSEDGSKPVEAKGRPPVESSSPQLDLFVLFANLAARTERILLGTGLYLLPLRNPLATARMGATLDIVSGGRLILGVGVGWLRSEFEILGEKFHNRGQRTDEAIRIVTDLWTQDRVSFNGAHYQFDAINFEPKPVQRPHPPIVIGGESKAALRRAATLAQGWYGHAQSLSELEPKIDMIRGLREEHGLAHLPFQISVRTNPDVTVEKVRELETLGVDRIILGLGQPASRSSEGILDDLERIAETVLSRL